MFFVMFVFSKMKRTYSPVEVSALLLFLATNLSVLFAIEMLFSLQVRHQIIKIGIFLHAYGALFLCSIFSVWLYHFMTQTVQKGSACANCSQAGTANQRTPARRCRICIQICLPVSMISRAYNLQAIEQLVQQQPPQAAEYLAKYKERISERNTFVAGSIRG